MEAERRESFSGTEGILSPGTTSKHVRSLSRQLSTEISAQSAGGKSASVVAADISTFERDLQRRNVSYDRRETAYLNRIKDLESTLQKTRQAEISDRATEEKFNSLKGMHKEIMANLDLVKGATSTIMQDQERDLLRSFRARLFDVQTELDREKSKKDDGAATWITKARQLEAEVDWATGMADMLCAKNEALRTENSELRARYVTGEEDRKYLIKQLVAVKKENMVLGADVDKLEADVTSLKEKRAAMNMSGSGGVPMFSSVPVAEPTLAERDAAMEAAKAKSLNEIKRVKVLLAEQQMELRAARHAYAADLTGRSELQRLLKQCLLDIRQRISIKSTPSYARDKSLKTGGGALLSGAVRTGRQSEVLEGKSLELLRSQDRVISMLYHKAFPVENATSGGASGWQPQRGNALPNPMPQDMVESATVSDWDRQQALNDTQREREREKEKQGKE